MQGNVKLLDVINKSGEKKDKSGSYSIFFAVFLTADFDKVQLIVSDEDADILRGLKGRNGTLTLGYNSRREQFQYGAFKVA